MFDPHARKDELSRETMRLKKLGAQLESARASTLRNIRNATCGLIIEGIITRSSTDLSTVSESMIDSHVASLFNPVDTAYLYIYESAQHSLQPREIEVIESCGDIINSMSSAVGTNGLTIKQFAEEMLSEHGFTMMKSRQPLADFYFGVPKPQLSLYPGMWGSVSPQLLEMYSSGEYFKGRPASLFIPFVPSRVVDEGCKRIAQAKHDYDEAYNGASHQLRGIIGKEFYPRVRNSASHRRRASMRLEEAKKEYNATGDLEGFDEGVDRIDWCG